MRRFRTLIVDSSTLIAIFLNEPEQAPFEAALVAAGARRMSAGTWIELSAVATRRKVIPTAWLDRVLDVYQIGLEPVTVEQAHIGHQAYLTFGLGSGHPARLNFGACFSYALAKATGEPLLFKGDDFNHTDISKAL